MTTIDIYYKFENDERKTNVVTIKTELPANQAVANYIDDINLSGENSDKGNAYVVDFVEF